MSITPIEARCRRCGGWMLTSDWTAKLLEDAAVADIAQRHLVGALRSLRNLPGNAVVRPQMVLRNLFEEVGWQKDLAEDSEMLRGELRGLRRLVAVWERLDPFVAAAQPRRSWIQRFRATITGTAPEPVVADGPLSSGLGDVSQTHQEVEEKQMVSVATGT